MSLDNIIIIILVVIAVTAILGIRMHGRRTAQENREIPEGKNKDLELPGAAKPKLK